jgi:hypothetical protein
MGAASVYSHTRCRLIKSVIAVDIDNKQPLRLVHRDEVFFGLSSIVT